MSVVKWLLVGIAVMVLTVGAVWYRNSQQSFHLLNAEELSERNHYKTTEGNSSRDIRVTRADGPEIRFSSPGQDVLASPVNIDVSISSKGGVPVDMSSIRIDYKLGPRWINVTGRIMKHASVTGSRLYARAAELPAGKHTMRLSVQDNKMRQTQVMVSFVIR